MSGALQRAGVGLRHAVLTSNSSWALGGMTPPAPRLPYASSEGISSSLQHNTAAAAAQHKHRISVLCYLCYLHQSHIQPNCTLRQNCTREVSGSA
jgi:hypothetical protein